MKLTCARCRQTLVSEPYEGRPLHRCEKCRGLWVDQDDLERILASPRHRDTAKRLRGSKNPWKPDPHSDSAIACLRCDGVMRVFLFGESEIELDRCPHGCGVWFDAGEFERAAGKSPTKRKTAAEKKNDGNYISDMMEAFAIFFILWP